METKKTGIYGILIILSLLVVSCSGNKKQNLPETKDLNAFFSAISSNNTPQFKRGGINDDILINFGVSYNYQNFQNELFQQSADNVATISQKAVADTAFKFFGESIKIHKSSGEIKYKDNTYNIQNASGEVFLFSQVKKIEESGKDEYTVSLDVYSASSGWTGDVDAKPETWKIGDNADDAPTVESKMKAIIKRKQSNGFVLLEYLKEL